MIYASINVVSFRYKNLFFSIKERYTMTSKHTDSGIAFNVRFINQEKPVPLGQNEQINPDGIDFYLMDHNGPLQEARDRMGNVRFHSIPPINESTFQKWWQGDVIKDLIRYAVNHCQGQSEVRVYIFCSDELILRFAELPDFQSHAEIISSQTAVHEIWYGFTYTQQQGTQHGQTIHASSGEEKNHLN